MDSNGFNRLHWILVNFIPNLSLKLLSKIPSEESLNHIPSSFIILSQSKTSINVISVTSFFRFSLTIISFDRDSISTKVMQSMKVVDQNLLLKF